MKIVKPGKPLPPGEETIPTQPEIALLVALWDTLAPRRFRGLLSSGAYVKGAKPKTRFVWDTVKRQYRTAAGQPIPRGEIRKAFASFVNAYSKRTK